MIKATRNQLGNVTNQFQTKAKKILAVCSAGLLRSPTTANILHKEFGFNTRACGSCKDFALIPISEALIVWADEIVFVNWDNFDDLDFQEKETILNYDKTFSILSIPDEHSWGEPELEKVIIEQFNRRVKHQGEIL